MFEKCRLARDSRNHDSSWAVQRESHQSHLEFERPHTNRHYPEPRSWLSLIMTRLRWRKMLKDLLTAIPSPNPWMPQRMEGGSEPHSDDDRQKRWSSTPQMLKTKRDVKKEKFYLVMPLQYDDLGGKEEAFTVVELRDHWCREENKKGEERRYSYKTLLTGQARMNGPTFE